MSKLSKIITFCICCCILLAVKAIDSGKYQNDLATRNLKGKVKSCIDYHYNSYRPTDDIDSGWVYSTADTFNVKGSILSTDISGNPFKKPVSERFYWAYAYDNNNREIETKDISGKIISRLTYDKNAENNLVEFYWSESSSKPMFKIIYNRSGRRDTMYDYDVAGGFMGTVIYRYNKSNDLIEEDRYSANGKLTHKDTYDYDERNRKISEMQYNNSGVKSGKINYAYDEYGNMTTEIDSSVIYFGGERVFSVDSNNKNIRIFKCSFGNLDSHHNWLREDMFYNNRIVKTFKRKIDYYR